MVDLVSAFATMERMKPRPTPPSLEKYFNAPDISIMTLLNASQTEMNRVDRYLSWDELRYRTPPPELTCEQWWISLKLQRANGRRDMPLLDKKGRAFSYSHTILMVNLLHQIDMLAGGTLQANNSDIFSETDRNKYIITSIMEEAIMSSMLEGAVVTRSEAKELIRSNRLPSNEHERMVMNNYRTMQQILVWKNDPITPEKVMELHRIMTEGTLEDPNKAGKYRTAADAVRVETAIEGELIHMPPLAEELPARMKEMCKFANGKDGDNNYIHPALRAIILHFWLAYDHPFVDGNGRTARALFYWLMLKEGFWAFEYISISHEIFSHPKRYYNAFINTEEDDNDLNYFISDQLLTIVNSIKNLYNYVKHKKNEQRKIIDALKLNDNFNNRHRALIVQLLKHPGTAITVTSYCHEYCVVRQTARTDLNLLVGMGLLTMKKINKEHVYFPIDTLEKRLHDLSNER